MEKTWQRKCIGGVSAEKSAPREYLRGAQKENRKQNHTFWILWPIPSYTFLAKVFLNVYIDMCWAHIISPTACVNSLVEWAGSVLLNKINVFGGDYCFIDGVSGHQHMARMNVSRALAIKVEEGLFDVEEAKRIGKMIFYDTPKELFHLKNV